MCVNRIEILRYGLKRCFIENIKIFKNCYCAHHRMYSQIKLIIQCNLLSFDSFLTVALIKTSNLLKSPLI